MKHALVLAAALLLSGCAHDAMQSSTAGQGVTVDLLFIKDGVSVYRFPDGGHYHYYAVSRNGPASVSSAWQECRPCGKSTCCHEEREEMQTVARR